MDSTSLDERRRVGGDCDYWSSIPEAILFLIAEKIDNIDDYVRLCAVCRSWYLLATDFYDIFRHKLKPSGPLCMSRPDPNSKLITLRYQTSTWERSLPEKATSHCWGSPFGWLVTYGPQCTLFNPVTGATIPLPPLPEESGPVINAFLTANPDSDPENCLVFLQCKYDKLAFVIRPIGGGDTKIWSPIKGRLDLSHITFSKGNLYGLKYWNSIFSRVYLFQFNHSQNGGVIHRCVDINLMSYYHSFDKRHLHLVDFNGELCLCVRYYDRDSFSTTRLMLYRIDLATGKLVRFFSLGDQCLFLGDTYSFSCKTMYTPNSNREIAVSNYVFYNYNRHWVGLTDKRSSTSFEVEAWDMLNSRMVHRTSDSSTPLYGPHWTTLPSINFQKLEVYAPSSIPPTPTPTPELLFRKVEDALKSLPTPGRLMTSEHPQLEVDAPTSIPTPTPERLFGRVEDALKSLPTPGRLLWVGKSVFLIFVLSRILNN